MTAAVGWAVRDSWALTRRTLTHWANQPAQLVLGLLFPIMVVLMFGYVFGGAMVVAGGDYREFLMPGMYTLTLAFGVEATYTAVSTDAARGVTDRFRSLPMAQGAVLTGRSTADMINSAVGLVAMALCGLAVGWRWHHGPVDAVLAFGLLLLLRFALLWLGIWLALVIGAPESVVALQILVWPLGFLSNLFTSPEEMPGWLAAVATWNPLSATAAACRQLFGNPGWSGDSWADQHAVALAIAWPLVLTAVFGSLSIHRYRRAGR